jgi:hypothetical protein
MKPLLDRGPDVRRYGWWVWGLLAAGTLLGLAVLYLTAPVRRFFGADEDLENENLAEGAVNGLADAVRQLGDTVSASPFPARWGGGIRQLLPAAQPFFQALFTAMEARGWEPKSNYPHASYNEAAYGPGPRALDIYDARWPRNAWQTPTPETILFYRTLGEVAESLGLTWGGRWSGFSGDGASWAKLWKAQGMGDMLHVEYRRALGAAVPLIDGPGPEEPA